MTITPLREHALSLPEATEEPHFGYSSFRVRGKIFATVPPDEEHLHVFIAEQRRASALDAHPEFIEELHWGKKIIGLRITLATAKPAVVKDLMTQAWHDKAPKSLHLPRKPK
jgi:hypothetical protein